ncbi:unnamed protein product [Urochloa decumbens]|uniref:Uncharacterized protein n=1 Tax=Urochloa decumbens TaxID=240449 RepID=A0ABC9G9T9_9POAL
MSTEGNASGSQGGDNSHDVVRRSPRLNVAENMKLKNRRARLRLPNRLPAPPPPNSASDWESEDDDKKDDDFLPAAINRNAVPEGHGINRKRHRNQGPADTSTHAPDPEAAPVAGDKKKRSMSAIRCSPLKFRNLVDALSEDLKEKIRAKNFGGLLDFKPQELDRRLLSWLMTRLNPNTMRIELSGDQSIAITQHSVWCVFHLPNEGPAPTPMKDDVLRSKRKELGIQIYGTEVSRIKPKDIEDLLRERKLTGDIGLRAFFINKLQTPRPSLATVSASTSAPTPPQFQSGTFDAAGMSHQSAATSHDPGGQAAAPVFCSYPKLGVAFAQRIVDLVGRSRKSQAQKILDYFDESTRVAHSYVAQAIDLMTRSKALIATAHHQCYTSIQKLLDDAKAEKLAANAARRVRPRTQQAPVVEDEFQDPEQHEHNQGEGVHETPPGPTFDYGSRQEDADGTGAMDPAEDSVGRSDDAAPTDVQHKPPEFNDEMHDKVIADKTHVPAAKMGLGDDIHASDTAKTGTGSESLPSESNKDTDGAIFGDVHAQEHASAGRIHVANETISTEDEILNRQMEDEMQNKQAAHDSSRGEAHMQPTDDSHVVQEHANVDINLCDAVPTELAQGSRVAEQQRLDAEREQAFLKEDGLLMSKVEREKCDAHERRLNLLREDAEQEIDQLISTIDVIAGPSITGAEQVFPEDSPKDIYSQSPPVRLSQEERLLGSNCHNQFQRFIYNQVGDRLRRRPRKFISPFKIVGCRPKVPKERALAMRNRIANDKNLQGMTLLDFSIFLSYTGKDSLTTFADDKSGENNLLDYIVHCLRFDDIVHKQDSIGYRVFLTTGLWTAAKDVVEEYMDDGKTETEPFKNMREHLEVQTEHYELTKAKLFKGMIYRIEMMHYAVFHALNQADLPNEMDIFRLGGKKIEFDQSQ